jgi:hypothetical protein
MVPVPGNDFDCGTDLKRRRALAEFLRSRRESTSIRSERPVMSQVFAMWFGPF